MMKMEVTSQGVDVGDGLAATGARTTETMVFVDLHSEHFLAGLITLRELHETSF